MINSKLYTLENVTRAYYAKVAGAVLVFIVCGYLVVTSALSTRDIWSANRALNKERGAAVTLRREADSKRRRDAREPLPSSGGVEIFALAFSQWVSTAGARVESIVPEGAPASSEVTFGGVKLGTWNASKVRVQGRAAFAPLMSLLEDFKDPGMAVALESFSIQTSDGNIGSVSFDLVVTVYEKKNGTG